MTLRTSSQNIDDLIRGIESITQNRCSLSDEDRDLLQKVITMLKKCKERQIGRDAASLLLIVRAVELLTKFFLR